MTTLDHMNMLLADGVSSTTVAWFTLAGALGGVLVTGLVSLVTVTLNHRWQSQGTEQQRLQDHNTLVRHERRESYAAYWLAWNQFTHRLRRLSNEVFAGNIVNGLIISSAGALLTGQLNDLIEKTWEAELEWRAAADALLLIADPEVEEAAKVHIAMTEQKLAAAWEGRSYHDENGTAYHALNDAMKNALLTPSLLMRGHVLHP